MKNIHIYKYNYDDILLHHRLVKSKFHVTKKKKILLVCYKIIL